MVYPGALARESKKKRTDSEFLINSDFYGFIGKPRNKKEWFYVNSILGIKGVENLIDAGRESELKLCAYARRVEMSPDKIIDTVERQRNRAKGCFCPNKAILKRKYDRFYSFVDAKKGHNHYNQTQVERWLPDEWRGAGKNLGHSPSDEELADFINFQKEISAQFRVWYTHMYPDMLTLDETYYEGYPQVLREKILSERIETKGLEQLTDTELNVLRLDEEVKVKNLIIKDPLSKESRKEYKFLQKIRDLSESRRVAGYLLAQKT